MKTLSKYYPDKWSSFIRVYKDQSKLEKHLVQFCTTLMENTPEKSIWKLMKLINQEVCKYSERTKGKIGRLNITRVQTAGYVGSDRKAWGIALVRPGRFPFLEISEPI